jgi:elongation factor G
VSFPDISSIRNLGIVAHIDVGKTTISERILFYSGVERRMGEVHEGTAVMDWMEEERKRGITITAAATSVPWKSVSINLVDTPGHVDFTIEVERCMRVLDGAILVISAAAGLQAQSEAVWRQLKRHNVPYLAFVNQCDRAGADFMQCVDDLKSKLNEPAIAIQYPLIDQPEFRVVVDLIERRAYQFRKEDLGRAPVEVPIGPGDADEVDVLRAELIEALAEENEELLNLLSDDVEPSPDLLRQALRTRVLARTLIPVMAGAAASNVGIQPLLDAVAWYLPSPADLPDVAGRVPNASGGLDGAETESRPPDPEAPLAALVFKLQLAPSLDLVFARIYSGTLKVGQTVFNPRTGLNERISNLLRMHAEERVPVERIGPGEVIAIEGLGGARTGDTLCLRDAPIVLERLEFPEPVITEVVEPATEEDREALGSALARLTIEDPTLSIDLDADTGQWLVAGMGELHLDVLVHRLQREFGLSVRAGRPRVAYREVVLVAGSGMATVDHNLAGGAYSGQIELELVPADLGLATQVEWIEGCDVPADCRAVVEQTLLHSAHVGGRFGYPLAEARIRVTGRGRAGDSEPGYCQAAVQALRHAVQSAQIELMEPVMIFEVTTPPEFMSGVLAELKSKRAEIREVSSDFSTRTINGRIAMADMFGYSTVLRSLSQGRASFSLFPDGYRSVPPAEIEARGLGWG